MSVTTAIQSATRAIGSIISGSPSEPEILDTLKQEHGEVAEMLKNLVDSRSGAQRKSLLARIKSALLPHIQAEQAALYHALIAIGDKKIQQHGKEGYIEHELAAATLVELETISNAMSPDFGAAAKVLKELIEHHVKEEESAVWSDAKDKFSADERVLMNHKYLAAKQLVGTSEIKAVPQPMKAAVAAKAKSKVVAPPKKTVPAAKAQAKGAAVAKKAVAAPQSKPKVAPKKATGTVKPDTTRNIRSTAAAV